MSPRLRYGLKTWISLVICWSILGPLHAYLYARNGVFFRPWDEVQRARANDPEDLQIVHLTTIGDRHYGMTSKSHYLCWFDDQADVELTTSPDMPIASRVVREAFRWGNPWTLVIMGVQVGLLAMIVTGVLLTWRGWPVRATFYIPPLLGLLLIEGLLPVVFQTGQPLYGRTGLSGLLTTPFETCTWTQIVSGFPRLDLELGNHTRYVIGIPLFLILWIGAPLLAAREIKRPEQLNDSKVAENEKRDDS
jgi:hypothetical protein